MTFAVVEKYNQMFKAVFILYFSFLPSVSNLKTYNNFSHDILPNLCLIFCCELHLDSVML